MKAINETIANAIVENIEGNEGTFSVEVEVNNTLVVVDGRFEIDGYCEDDYFNGTGAWVTTYVSVYIDGIEAYDEDGNEVDVDCDLTEIERSVERLAA
ncbi:unknown [Bacteroides sp. CAG:633]|mgnify:FL=1|uniref:hypothetical protein n=1 Tax=Bacteroides sp. CAG:633 TaxID=1262744 RepID=UPI00033572F0|nr:hypothetical protein [Bacteroides sp. CAG:633]CDB12118.1 unknown [Bacteroides sp. CAG:633]